MNDTAVPKATQGTLAQLGLDLAFEVSRRDSQFNICPTQRAGVVHVGEQGAVFEMMRWGLVPPWAKDIKFGAHCINARQETARTKPAFRSAFKRPTSRALIPASAYYEWTGETPKQPFLIEHPAKELLMFAGLWERWKDPENDAWLHTFTVVTGEPGKVSGDVHDRQPVILPPDLFQAWLTGDADTASDVLDRCPEAELTYYPVSKAVSSPRNHGPELIEPISLDT